MKNLSYLLALHSIDGLGAIRLKRLIDYYKDPKDVWHARPSELKQFSIPQNVIELFEKTRESLDPKEYAQKLENWGIKVVTLYDAEYPKRLKEIYDPPVILYYFGEILAKDERAIGVVGTRKMTGYGRTVTEKFSQELAAAGFTVVSGLAKGVDTLAHRIALESNGRTIAVLGGGLRVIFPPENTSLANKIADGFGAVITEFPPEHPHLPGNFPARNRIIAGLSLAVLVTEAAEDSGSLITARLALDQGREVFAIPGPITSSLAKGPANLIKDGARLVFEPADILEELGLDQSPINNDQLTDQNLSQIETLVLESLKDEGKHIDEICREAKLHSAAVAAALIKMEIVGLVKSLGGGNYIKAL